MKALIRPILTIILVVAWIAFIFFTYNKGGSIVDVPELFTSMVWTAFVWWFASREKEKSNSETVLSCNNDKITTVTITKSPHVVSGKESANGHNK